MRVLITLPDNSLGGAEQYLKMVAEYYCSKGAQVFIFFMKDSFKNSWKDLNEFNNVKTTTYSSSSNLRNTIKLYKDLKRLKNHQFDFVFTSHVKITGLLGLFRNLGRLKTKNFIARESTSIFKRYSGLKLQIYKCYYLGYFNVDVLVCQTQLMKDEILKFYPTFKNKIIIIDNPIDLNLINTLEKEEIFIENDYIVSAGRLIEEKGFDLLIRAFHLLRNNKRYTNLKLIILGEGNQRKFLEELVSSLNLKNEVKMIGLVLNVYPYFRDAKACVVSSRIEGFPNVLLQMMSQNNNVVSTKCAGGIIHIPNIEVCDTNDYYALHKSILNILETDTKKNRFIFDELLKKRTIESYINKIQNKIS